MRQELFGRELVCVQGHFVVSAAPSTRFVSVSVRQRRVFRLRDSFLIPAFFIGVLLKESNFAAARDTLSGTGGV